MRGRIAGHLWTIGPAARGLVPPRPAVGERPLTLRLPDPRFGHVTLDGWLAARSRRDALLMIVHGLGGSPDSPYVLDAARAARAAGFATMRVGLRGATEAGDDLYHAGLYADLVELLRAPALRRFSDVMMLGYSLGGHVALRLAVSGAEPRLRGVAAVCSPLDLAASCQVIDGPRALPYRGYVLSALKRMYRRLDARGRAVSDARDVRRARTLRQWDERVVVVRHGFADADDYYARESVGPRLAALPIPALYVGARHDPMVPPHAVEPSLRAAGEAMHVRWLARGGHVGFPRDAWNGARVEQQVVRWLAEPQSVPPPLGRDA